jgi:hypothetical protein
MKPPGHTCPQIDKAQSALRKLAWRAAGGVAVITPAEVMDDGLRALEEVRAENRQMREAHTWARAEADRLGQELAALRTRMQELEAGEARRMFLDSVCFGEPHERAQLAVYARELLKDDGDL